MTSETTPGHFKLKIEIVIWGISQAKKKCLPKISFMIKLLMNLILTGSTLKNALKIIVTIILLLVITLLIKEIRSSRIDRKVIN
jgi:hypothetical protein